MARRKINTEKAKAIGKEMTTKGGGDLVQNLPKWGDGESRELRVVPHVNYAKFLANNFEDDDAMYEGEEAPFKVIWVHGGRGYVVSCAEKHGTGKCAFCDHAKEFINSEDEDIKSEAKRNFPSRKLLTYVLWVDNPDVSKRELVYRWVMSATTAKEFTSVYSNADYAEGIDDPEEGANLTVTRTGTGFDTLYSVQPRRNSSGIFEVESIENGVTYTDFDLDTFQRLVGNIPNIDEDYLIKVSYSEGESLLTEEKSLKDIFKARNETDEEAPIEEAPVTKRNRRPRG